MHENVGKFQGPEYRGVNPWKGESSWYRVQRRRPEQFGAGQSGSLKGMGREIEFGAQEPYSNHPMVSGAIEYRNVCWIYGNAPNADGLRYDSRSCQNAPLQDWESDVFRNKRRQRKEEFERREIRSSRPLQTSEQPTTNEVEIGQRRRKRYEAAGLPQPYCEEQSVPCDNAIEEMSVEDLIELHRIMEQEDG